MAALTAVMNRVVQTLHIPPFAEPVTCNAPIIATAISAAIKAYSIEATPICFKKIGRGLASGDEYRHCFFMINHSS